MSEANMREIISTGWLAMLLIMMTMTLLFVLEGVKTGELANWLAEATLWPWAAFFGLAIAMLFLVRVMDARWFRWVVFAVLVLWTLKWGSSWIQELVEDLGRPPYYIILKTLRNILSVYITWIAWRWVQSRDLADIRPKDQRSHVEPATEKT